MSKKFDLASMSIAELTDAFLATCYAELDQMFSSDIAAATATYHRRQAIVGELRRRSPDQRPALAVFLSHEHPAVRYWAAVQLLGIMPDRALPVIEETDRKASGPLGCQAMTTLMVYRSGEFRPT